MKTSDFIAKFLADAGIDTAFVLTGGCIVHVIDSIASTQGIDYIPVQHEQAGAMAADTFSRIKGAAGLALATSGPGATNLVTGVCCSFYDSIPVIVITGQVPSGQLKRKSNSRQIGFQETDVVSIFKSITKYAVLVDNAENIRFELEKALYFATEGRPGPVLLDICDDVQRADIDPDSLRSFSEPRAQRQSHSDQITQIIRLINDAERPVLIFGGGVRSAGEAGNLQSTVADIGIPFSLTWAVMDACSSKDPLNVGGFGVTSGRPGNFAVQNSDLLICFGTRLDTHEAGSNYATFAREAKKIIVDIDPAEQEKYKDRGLEVDLLVTADVGEVLRELVDRAGELKPQNLNAWLNRISGWKENYPICPDEYHAQEQWVNPYVFMESLATHSVKDAIVVTDCGSNLIWTMQAFACSGLGRIVSAFNHSPMGYSLPACIGAALASPDQQVICITGDAGLQINIQELATIQRQSLNIKIFVMNNHCHGIIQGTQDNWLESRHHASDPKLGGLPDPDFMRISNAYDIPSVSISCHEELDATLDFTLKSDGPVLCNVDLLPASQIYPKLLFGRPIEDSSPLLPREEFYENMMVKPIS
ncbi:MAG TPA: acetolactate synthase [Gammaproteobacteria bacterium]|nr:acetolactate synthase [Gammaproteobacteria bacterium]